MMNANRRLLALDLNQSKRNLPQPLSTPDLNLLKVGTPELEKIILDNPIENQTGSQSNMMFQRSSEATEEQERFSAGFEVALNNLHNGHLQASDNSNSSIFTDLDQSVNNPNHHEYMSNNAIKEEPHTVPTDGESPSVGVAPVDMEFQERMKLERKRLRNRLAASKCRSRKLERISKLEDKVRMLKGENAELGTLITQLREHVNGLKVEVLDHVNNGCQIVV